MNIILGNPAVEGVGIGVNFVIPGDNGRIIPEKEIGDKDLDAQWVRYEKSLANVTKEISNRLSEIKDDKLQKEIFETYFLMLSDPEFAKELKTKFYGDKKNIEFVLNKLMNEYADKLRNSGNEYLAERAQDITDIFGRVLDDLLDYHPFNIEEVPDGCVIMARELKPSDTIILSKRKIVGLALTEGGVSSHVAILARSYGIPSVFDLQNITNLVKPGEIVIVDGNVGEALVNPDELTIKVYREQIEKEKKEKEELEVFRNKEATTKDGTKFQLMANIGTVEEAKMAFDEGADGIGLFRTEFLFMAENFKNNTQARSLSHSEEMQFNAYKTVLETMRGKPVTIRTLDAGGDKQISALDMPVETGKNPLLSLRAIRLSLKYPQQLKTQFRALYRASVYGNLKIMLPLITGIEQVEAALAIAEEAKAELEKEGKPFKKDVPIGVMIETAAAAIISDCIAKKADFFSIGTNDLTQYTLGIDREDSLVSEMYDEFHLAVLRLIHHTIGAARDANIPISVCGEMASRKDSVIILAGMGLRTLSMSSKKLSQIKKLLSQFQLAELQAISSKRLNEL